MTYDIDRIRADFPALQTGQVFFDGPGGTQTPRQVVDAMRAALEQPLSNRGVHTAGERNAEAIVGAARSAVADLLGATPDGVVFGRSATQLTYDFSRMLSRSWGPADEVVVTRLDHDANVRPWIQAAERAGATVRWAEFDPDSTELTVEDVAAVLSDRTRVVAVTGASNLVGTRPPIGAIADAVHAAGALLYVDAVHLAAHARVDLTALGADFVVCSPYKFLGPHLGVLAARRELLEALQPDKLLPATDDVPERFELGTLPYELLAGTTAAVEYLAAIDAGSTGADRPTRLTRSLGAIETHEDELRVRIEAGLASLHGVTVRSRARSRTPTLLVTLDGRSTVDAYRHLAERGVAAPAGSFYAIEPSRHLGLGGAGGLRIGLAPYNHDADVDRLLEALDEFLG